MGAHVYICLRDWMTLRKGWGGKPHEEGLGGKPHEEGLGGKPHTLI